MVRIDVRRYRPPIVRPPLDLTLPRGHRQELTFPIPPTPGHSARQPAAGGGPPRFLVLHTPCMRGQPRLAASPASDHHPRRHILVSIHAGRDVGLSPCGFRALPGLVVGQRNNRPSQVLVKANRPADLERCCFSSRVSGRSQDTAGPGLGTGAGPNPHGWLFSSFERLADDGCML